MITGIKLTEEEQKIWNNLVKAYLQFAQASIEFTKPSVNRAKIIKNGLCDKNRITAIFFLQYLNQEELKEIFDELINLASFGHGAIGAVRDAIISLPREWVLLQIEDVVEPYLLEADYEDETYRRFLELYTELDDKLTERLARRASESDNLEVREAGIEFLNRL